MQNPLNSRLGPRPTGSRMKGTSRKDTLKGVPVEIQEALILEDLLFVLMVRIQVTKLGSRFSSGYPFFNRAFPGHISITLTTLLNLKA